ncbi:MAG: DNA primase [Eubacteriales bacterium]|nr:DNA primase [Eubacteriales bacterium]MDD3537311.1 DNA primase [Eubacteriales bacterium]NLV70006.1 DNA primase [Clostridiales bacterium]
MAQQNYQSVIDEIKSRCNIVDIISPLVPLKRAGTNQKGICPFHNEKTPSFVVSDAKQIFTCFGCGASGDVIEFVKRYYNLTFPEAVERLALQCGISIPESHGELGKKKEGYYEINRQAARFYFSVFAGKKNPGLTYMIQRGIEPPVLKAFGIGYADDSWDSLTKALTGQGFDQGMLLELGLISQKNGHLYDKFRSRVIFPIINTRGKVIGFGGRMIGEGEPKYLNSQESIVFQKKYNLFGLNLTRSEIQKEGYAVLVEGYMDVIGLYQHGIRNVAASLGTALTQQQARLLKRYTEKVILCYDSDQAGIDAALRGADVLRREGLEVRILNVPQEKDPDEYIRKRGREAFLNLIHKKALPDVEYKIALLKSQYDLNDTTQSIKFLQKISDILRTLTPVEADLYIGKVSAEYRISEGALRREVQRQDRNVTSSPQTKDESRGKTDPVAAVSESTLSLERMILRLILLKSEYLEGIREYPEAIVTPPGRRLISVFQELFTEDSDLELEAVRDALEEDELAYLETILREVQVGEKDEDAYADCIAKLQEQRLEKRKKEIIDLLSLAEETGSQSQLDDLMKEYMMIQQMQKR